MRGYSCQKVPKGPKLRHTLNMSDKFLKSDLRDACSQKSGRGYRVFLQPR